MKHTGYYTGDQKPVRRGVFKRRLKTRHIYLIQFSYWNGKRWGLSKFSVIAAYEVRKIESQFQDREWCGLSSEPENKE